MIFGIHVYQVKTVWRMQEWLLSLVDLLSYLHGMNFIGERFCVQSHTYALRDIFMIIGLHIYQVKVM